MAVSRRSHQADDGVDGKSSWGDFSTKEVAKLNTEEVMPYILIGKYDIDLVDKENRKF